MAYLGGTLTIALACERGSLGRGCTVHLRAEELPAGRLVVSLSKHVTAVVNGVIRDTYDPSRGGTSGPPPGVRTRGP